MIVEKKWLVKSSDSIQGPLEFDTVVENIFKGEIHLLDEIKGPFERWRPIKDHSLFAAAIEKLKATTYSSRGENTMTQTLDLQTRTEQTATDTITTNDQTLSPTPVMTNSHITQPGVVPPMPTPPQNQQGVGGYQPSTQSQSKRFPTVFIFTFLLLVFATAGYLVYEFKQNRLIEQKISAYGQLTDKAIDALKVGEYQAALKSFQMAYNISPNDPNLIIEMSPLSVQFDGQFSQVQLQLENLILNNRQKAIEKLAKNVIGLTYSYRKQYKKALDNYNEVLQQDNQFLPTLINKSFVSLQMKQPDKAVGVMSEVVKDHPEQAVAHYIYIRSLLDYALQESSEALLLETLSVADQFSQKFSDFKQEVLFLIAVAQFKRGVQGEALVGHIKNFLKVDISLTSLHVHDPQIDFQAFNWVDYTKYCQTMGRSVDDYHKKLLEGFCLLKVGGAIEAKKIFEELLPEKSEDGILQSLYIASLLQLDNLSQAKNALGFINQIDQKQPVVETLLRGCLQAGDLSCGEALFRGSHAKHISLLYSHWGNSAINFDKDRRKAKSSISLGLEISPSFAPLLKLKSSL